MLMRKTLLRAAIVAACLAPLAARPADAHPGRGHCRGRPLARIGAAAGNLARAPVRLAGRIAHCILPRRSLNGRCDRTCD